MKIRLFIKPYCGWCHKAQRWLIGDDINLLVLDAALVEPVLRLVTPAAIRFDEETDFHVDKTQSSAMNSSTVIPAVRIKLRSVPLAISLWSGTESVAISLSLTMMM